MILHILSLKFASMAREWLQVLCFWSTLYVAGLCVFSGLTLKLMKTHQLVFLIK